MSDWCIRWLFLGIILLLACDSLRWDGSEETLDVVHLSVSIKSSDFLKVFEDMDISMSSWLLA